VLRFFRLAGALPLSFTEVGSNQGRQQRYHAGRRLKKIQLLPPARVMSRPEAGCFVTASSTASSSPLPVPRPLASVIPSGSGTGSGSGISISQVSDWPNATFLHYSLNLGVVMDRIPNLGIRIPTNLLLILKKIRTNLIRIQIPKRFAKIQTKIRKRFTFF
jgi:hypothetical protein